MCGETGKAVLRALTGALLCGLVSDAAYLQNWQTPHKIEYHGLLRRPTATITPDFFVHMESKPAPGFDWLYGRNKHLTRPPYNKDIQYTTTYRYQHPSNYHYEEGLIRKPLREHEKPQDLSNVPGIPGHDYPIYHAVPETGFSCAHVPVHPGMYANVETGCQAYHVCHDGREGHQGASFLCTNGTLFHQEKFACDWWYNVDCSQAIAHYKLNADPLKNPYVPKPKHHEHHEYEPHGIFFKDV